MTLYMYICIYVDLQIWPFRDQITDTYSIITGSDTWCTIIPDVESPQQPIFIIHSLNVEAKSYKSQEIGLIVKQLEQGL